MIWRKALVGKGNKRIKVLIWYVYKGLFLFLFFKKWCHNNQASEWAEWALSETGNVFSVMKRMIIQEIIVFKRVLCICASTTVVTRKSANTTSSFQHIPLFRLAIHCRMLFSYFANNTVKEMCRNTRDKTWVVMHIFSCEWTSAKFEFKSEYHLQQTSRDQKKVQVKVLQSDSTYNSLSFQVQRNFLCKKCGMLLFNILKIIQWSWNGHH